MSVTSFSAEQVSGATPTIRISAISDGNPSADVQVEYSDDNSTWSVLGNIAAGGSGSYIDDSGLSPNQARYYRGSDDGGGNYATAQATTAPLPETPTVSATVGTTASITIGWYGNAYADDIVVVRTDQTNYESVTIYSGAANRGGTTDSSAKIGRVYSYVGTLRNMSGAGNPSPGALGCRPLLAADSPDPAAVRSGVACIAADLASVTTGTLVAETADYPAEADVKAGVTYANATMEGSYDPLAAAVFPAEANVSDTVTAYGPTGDEYAGSLPLANYVLKTDVVAAANVVLTVPRWTGATGADVGTVRVPPADHVMTTYAYGPSDSLTGTLVAIADEAALIESLQQYLATSLNLEGAASILVDMVKEQQQ